MSYVTDIRRELHMYPEVGYDLTRTLELVRRELNRFGIPYTESYGKSAIVATINEGKSDFTIGIRGDMDALPILEKTRVSYKSRNEGKMHACGHDAHTAILLDAARRLNEMKEQLSCTVKLLFQPAEEFNPPGASLMVADGVMDVLDCVIALHVDPKLPCGTVAVTPGPQNAISNGFMLDFYGRSSHVARQERGVDAIAMAVKAYTAIEIMVAKELPASSQRVFNVGSFHAGKTNNVICDHASMFCTLRTWDEATDAHVMKRIKGIISSVAKESGGKATFTQKKYYPIVYNHSGVTEKLRSAAKKVVGEAAILNHERTMEGEDFSMMLQKKPGSMFRLGIRNEEKGCVYALHQDHFNLDEDALSIGSDIFVSFVKENMNGIEF